MFERMVEHEILSVNSPPICTHPAAPKTGSTAPIHCEISLWRNASCSSCSLFCRQRLYLTVCRPLGHLAARRAERWTFKQAVFYPTSFLLPACPAVAVIGHWTTEQEKDLAAVSDFSYVTWWLYWRHKSPPLSLHLWCIFFSKTFIVSLCFYWYFSLSFSTYSSYCIMNIL